MLARTDIHAAVHNCRRRPNLSSNHRYPNRHSSGNVYAVNPAVVRTHIDTSIVDGRRRVHFTSSCKVPHKLSVGGIETVNIVILATHKNTAVNDCRGRHYLSLIHISEPTRLGMISYAVFCLKKKKKK